MNRRKNKGTVRAVSDGPNETVLPGYPSLRFKRMIHLQGSSGSFREGKEGAARLAQGSALVVLMPTVLRRPAGQS